MAEVSELEIMTSEYDTDTCYACPDDIPRGALCLTGISGCCGHCYVTICLKCARLAGELGKEA